VRYGGLSLVVQWAGSSGLILGSSGSVDTAIGLRRIVALDILIQNEDRHLDNLLLHEVENGTRVIGIDHEQAWVGVPLALEAKNRVNFEKYPESFLSQPVIRGWLPRISKAIAAVSENAWREIAEHTAVVVPQTDSALLSKRLFERAAQLPELADLFLRGHNR
jgi:hypothetical protein